MKTVLFSLVLLGLVASGYSECANACSGHGACAINDQCNCYRNWQSADCSERTCPFGLAFIDTPLGDLDGDGAVTHNNVEKVVPWAVQKVREYWPAVGVAGEAHFYRECSNKGLCNRKSGECECFDGYEGVACKRTVCPNACSGHGTCESIAELGEGNTKGGVQPSRSYDSARMSAVLGALNAASKTSATDVAYNLWDQDKSFGCKCDEGYSGPDCSLRECPTGDDPLKVGTCNDGTQKAQALCTGSGGTWTAQVDEIQTVACNTEAATFTLTFTDTFGEKWTTTSLNCDATGATPNAAAEAAIAKAALMALPNSVIEGVSITAQSDDGTVAGNSYAITFTHNSGNLPALTCAASAGACTVTETTAGTKEETTCSGRGVCDYSTGICKCFRGYTLDDCSAQNALAY